MCLISEIYKRPKLSPKRNGGLKYGFDFVVRYVINS